MFSLNKIKKKISKNKFGFSLEDIIFISIMLILLISIAILTLIFK